MARFLAAGADANARTTIGRETAAHIAARLGEVPVIQLLLTVPGIDLSVADSRGKTVRQVVQDMIQRKRQEYQDARIRDPRFTMLD